MISNEKVDDIMKIKKSLEESGLLIKGVSEAIKNEAKKTKKWISKGVTAAGEGAIATGQGKGPIRHGQDF